MNKFEEDYENECPMCGLEVDNEMGYCYNCEEFVGTDDE